MGERERETGEWPPSEVSNTFPYMITLIMLLDKSSI